ncbi:MAG: M48 family metallopeptidase [Hyphomonadaceae bacterium]|nr:M48 family metallopeptidase [Hyphomonadaceae bacterium]
MAAPVLSAVKRIVLALIAFAAASLALAAPASAQSLIRDAEIEDTLRVYATPLLQAAGLDPDDVTLYIVNDSSLNAFVAGGQNIFVHTGLILAADTPNELIGVLAHETAHISGGHLVRQREAIAQSMRTGLISIGLGVLAMAAGAPDAGAAIIASSQQFAMGNMVRHTRVQESAADQAAVQYLEATGQSPRGLLDFFNKNIRPYEFMVRRAPPYLVTHPFSSDRVEALRPRIDNSPSLNATDSEDYLRRFRFMQAKLVGFLMSQGQTLARYPLSDTSQPARYARAVAYFRGSDLEQSRRELQSLISEDPRNPYYQELMGQILFENGRAAESIPFHRRSIELDPGQPLLEVNLARALISANGRAGADEALPILQDVINAEPDNAYAWRELAQARELRGERALAELSSAELNFWMRNYPAAVSFAERARRSLPQGTPSYQRAVDIANFAGAEVREREQQRGSRRG